MPRLDDEDLRAAAAEAGITPAELVTALAVRDGTLGTDLATRPSALPIASPDTRGSVEARLAGPATAAAEAVRQRLEHALGARGHRQGDGAISILDERNGLTFHVRAAAEEAGAAIVRVDFDARQAAGERWLVGATGGGLAIALVGIGWFTTSLLVAAGAIVGAATALWITSRRSRERAALRRAHELAATGLDEAQRALPAGPTGAGT